MQLINNRIDLENIVSLAYSDCYQKLSTSTNKSIQDYQPNNWKQMLQFRNWQRLKNLSLCVQTDI